MNRYEQMREALEAARDALDTIMSTSCHNLREITASRASRKCREALALPPRNCEVGTAEEQFERWWAFCDQFDEDCTGCPYGGCHRTMAYCFAKWAQMPYEKGDAK